MSTTPPLQSVLLAPEQWSYTRDDRNTLNGAMVDQSPLPDRPISLLELKPSPFVVEATQVIYKGLLDDMHRVRFCRHCKCKFTLWHTMGCHPCWGHPGTLDQRRGLWKCCNLPMHGGTRPGFIDGCVPVDHLDAWVHRESHQHSTDTTSCIPLPVFLLMPDKGRRTVRAVYHTDYLPEHYKRAFVRARYGDMLEEDEEEDALEEWTNEHGASTFIPPALRGGGTSSSRNDNTNADDEENMLADYDESTFLWPQTDLRLDQFHVIIEHVAIR